MNITKVKVTMGRTLNMGNYSSVRFEFEAEATLTGNEDPEAVKDEVEEIVEDWLDAEADKWYKVREKAQAQAERRGGRRRD